MPIPTWETVRQYREAARTTNPISEQNLAFMVREMKKRGCKEVGGNPWDKMIVKEGIVLCKRTGELVGFEHLTINSELNMGPNNLQNEDGENTTESSDSDSIGPFDSDSDTNEMFYVLFINRGGLSWPVASFPLQKIDNKIISSLVWQVYM